MNRQESADYWCYRRAAVELHDLAEWLRLQIELDVSNRRSRLRVPFKERIEAIDRLMESFKGDRCQHVCKGMYFCELKRPHRGKLHQTAGGGLKWPSNAGFYF